MNDNCDPKDCPVSARVDALEREFDRYRGGSSDTHRQMFNRIGALEQSGATLKTKLDSIDEKLDELTSTVRALADKLVYAAALAVVAWIAAGMPGLK